MVNIDVRRLISFGKGSFILSMPKSWIEKNHLKKGDLISVTDDGCELTLAANSEEKKDNSSEIDINAKDKSIDLLKAEIVSSYLNGYDSVNILFDSKSDEVPKIKNIIRNLSGMEIMEQTSTRIVAKNLINISEISIKNIMRRMDIITRAMMEDAILCSKGERNYESLLHRDIDVNRLYYLGYRVIKNAIKNPRVAKSLGAEPWHLHCDSLILTRIEKIADCQKRIARYMCQNKLDRQLLEELGKVHTDISEAYSNVMKAYYNNDKKAAFDIELANRSLIASCNRLLEKYNSRRLNAKSKFTGINLLAVTKIIENLNTTAAWIRNTARTILSYE